MISSYRIRRLGQVCISLTMELVGAVSSALRNSFPPLMITAPLWCHTSPDDPS
jgi:hypothetical protein